MTLKIQSAAASRTMIALRRYYTLGFLKPHGNEDSPIHSFTRPTYLVRSRPSPPLCLSHEFQQYKGCSFFIIESELKFWFVFPFLSEPHNYSLIAEAWKLNFLHVTRSSIFPLFSCKASQLGQEVIAFSYEWHHFMFLFNLISHCAVGSICSFVSYAPWFVRLHILKFLTKARLNSSHRHWSILRSCFLIEFH